MTSLWTLAWVGALAASAWGQKPQFPGPIYPAGDSPLSLASGDLNGDGHRDLVVANFDSSTLSILLGIAGGDLAPGGETPTAAGPASVALLDWNGDGKLDAAAAHLVANSVGFYLGNGAGALAPGPVFPSGTNPTAVVPADFNNDGFIDVAFANFGSASVSVILGNGAGGGSVVSSVALGGPIALDAGDLNGDGALDLACAHFSAFQVSVLLGNGAGAFTGGQSIGTGTKPRGIALGDLNGDGKLDVASAGEEIASTKQVFTYLGVGNGGLVFHGSYSANQTIYGFIYGIRLAEMTGDGRLDLVAANASLQDTRVWTGDGAGGFVGSAIDYRVGGGQYAVALDDLDGDGVLDIATANAPSDTVAVVATGATGALVHATAIDSVAVGALRAGDLDKDGNPDLVGAASFGVNTLLGNGSGGFGPVHTYFAGSGNDWMQLADLNGDSILDAVARSTGVFVATLLGNGSGGFGAAQLVPTPIGLNRFALGDLDGDGKPDLAGVAGPSFFVLLGDGLGGFGSAATFPADPAPNNVQLVDVNNDGRLDALLTSYTTTAVSVLLGNGQGGFAPYFWVPTNPFPFQTVPGDLDRDGLVDFAVVSINAPVITTHLNIGGAFGRPVTVPGSVLAWEGNIVDVNGDGLSDLCVGMQEKDALGVYLGLGSGALAPPLRFAALDYPATLAPADLDLDGRIDAALGTRSGSSGPYGAQAAILLNRMPPPAGATVHGPGTHGCAGILGFAFHGEAKVGNATFAFLGSNAPASSLGLCIAGDVDAPGGLDPFSWGTTFYLDILASSQLYLFDFRSDASGAGFAPVPIPNNPGIAGAAFTVQGMWIEDAKTGLACSPAFAHLVTSKAIRFSIAP